LAANVTENVVQILAGGLTFHLREPIDLETKLDHGRFVVAYAPLNIDVYGPNRTEALEAFAEAFGDAWSYLVKESRNLSGDAIALKQAIESLVESVTPTGR
jgi:hypothetical protein